MAGRTRAQIQADQAALIHPDTQAAVRSLMRLLTSTERFVEALHADLRGSLLMALGNVVEKGTIAPREAKWAAKRLPASPEGTFVAALLEAFTSQPAHEAVSTARTAYRTMGA